jgi:hypothetical protein
MDDGLSSLAVSPEVWVHWDPVTKVRRGDRAMLSQRMDFLMMARATAGSCSRSMESGIIQRNGKPNPAASCRNHPSRRDLRLSSYEVYRFGGYELSAASLAHCQ